MKDLKILLEKTVNTVLKTEAITTEVLISILLVEDEEMRRINHEYRDKDSVTDVLSFPMLLMKDGVCVEEPGEMDMENGRLFLGDIVISVPQALEQAELYGHSVNRELAFLTVHGLLHLLGYDHDKSEREKRMISRQEQVLSELGLNRSRH